MSRSKFTALTTVGSALWNTLLIGAGWFLGNEWDRIQGPVSAASKVVLIAVSLGLIAGGWLLIRRRRTASCESE